MSWRPSTPSPGGRSVRPPRTRVTVTCEHAESCGGRVHEPSGIAAPDRGVVLGDAGSGRYVAELPRRPVPVPRADALGHRTGGRGPRPSSRRRLPGPGPRSAGRPHPDRAPVVAGGPADLAVTWLGHATSVVELDGHRFLLDPVFGERVSPSAASGPPAAPGSRPYRRDPAPRRRRHQPRPLRPSRRAVDRQLERSHQPHYVVPIGVDLHLECWGVPTERITASTGARRPMCAASVSRAPRPGTSPDVASCATRRSGLAGRCGGQPTPSSSAGDSGPTHRYADIGADLGPFDLTLIPIGAYSVHWPDIHLNPRRRSRRTSTSTAATRPTPSCCPSTGRPSTSPRTGGASRSAGPAAAPPSAVRMCSRPGREREIP